MWLQQKAVALYDTPILPPLFYLGLRSLVWYALLLSAYRRLTGPKAVIGRLKYLYLLTQWTTSREVSCKFSMKIFNLFLSSKTSHFCGISLVWLNRTSNFPLAGVLLPGKSSVLWNWPWIAEPTLYSFPKILWSETKALLQRPACHSCSKLVSFKVWHGQLKLKCYESKSTDFPHDCLVILLCVFFAVVILYFGFIFPATAMYVRYS